MKDSYSYEELVQCGQGDLFNPGHARLPLDNMLMFDRITRINSDGGKHGMGEIIAELDISPKLWFFDCHFKGDPVMPGCLGLDAMWQLLGFYLGHLGFVGRGRALGVGSVRFQGQVLPETKKITYVINIQRVIKRSLAMAVADGELYLDDEKEPIYKIQELKTGVFKHTESTAKKEL